MDTTIRLWDLAEMSTSTILTHHKKAVRSLLFHPMYGSFLACLLFLVSTPSLLRVPTTSNAGSVLMYEWTQSLYRSRVSFWITFQVTRVFSIPSLSTRTMSSLLAPIMDNCVSTIGRVVIALMRNKPLFNLVPLMLMLLSLLLHLIRRALAWSLVREIRPLRYREYLFVFERFRFIRRMWMQLRRLILLIWRSGRWNGEADDPSINCFLYLQIVFFFSVVYCFVDWTNTLVNKKK